MEVGRSGLSSSNSLSSFDGLRNAMINNNDWHDWDDNLDAIGAGTWPFELDLGFDHFLMTTADDLAADSGLGSPSCESNCSSDDDDLLPLQDLSVVDASSDAATRFAPSMMMAANHHGLGESLGCSAVDALAKSNSDEKRKEKQREAVKRHRKRKNAELQHLRDEAERLAHENAQLEKRVKNTSASHTTTKQMQMQQSSIVVKREPLDQKKNEQNEQLFRRRYDILHEILEAWNTGGIEDMEEIADVVYDNDVQLISPDYSEGLCGVQAIMKHWNLLLDVFPDGIMEEYTIEKDDPNGEKLKASWVFSGTQIYPIFGIEPRHEKVCIRGNSFFTFTGDKIRQVVLTWNYREALMKLMGVQPSNQVVLSAHVGGGSR